MREDDLVTTQTAVRERPILFSAEMVRALLDGRKTQTRRVVGLPVRAGVSASEGHRRADYRRMCDGLAEFADGPSGQAFSGVLLRCPYGARGERLWVREGAWVSECGNYVAFGEVWNLDTALVVSREGAWIPSYYVSGALYGKRRGFELGWGEGRRVSAFFAKQRPSIHMPRWASRISLEITDVRVERVQEISGEDARAEGVCVPRCGCEGCGRTSQMCPADASSHILEYARLWDSLNAPRGYGWDANPWVWAITFKRVEG
jgi:hypothetical protein